MARHARLVPDAAGGAHGRGAVVASRRLAVEEGPEGGAVQEQVPAAGDVLRQAHPAPLVPRGAPGEVRVAVSGQRRPGPRGVVRGAEALPVRRFGLLHPGVDVFGVVEVVVVEGVVFKGCAGQPGAFGGFDECASAGRDVLMATSLQRVVCCPAPHVFNVTGRGTGEM